MARDTKKGAKSEVLSMRMDPATRFLVDFVARCKGQSISTVVERAIQEAADRINLADDPRTGEIKWTHFWHINEGVRSLKMWSEKKLYPNYEEQFIVSFANMHWPFFYVTEKRTAYKEAYIDIIWPQIDEFAEIWRNTRTTDRWAAGRAMRTVILNAGVQPPDWPPRPPAPAPAAAQKNPPGQSGEGKAS
ncbi:MAG: hypothetical protein EKK29_11675 [Hyphomicrobiales bacterium]|nr:MAG: hypothetical protein EKK29_11675 [Hyphomicrobiales bacterium]